jgi:hypothetical protein
MLWIVIHLDTSLPPKVAFTPLLESNGEQVLDIVAFGLYYVINNLLTSYLFIL